MSYELKARRLGDGFWIMGTAAENLGARKLVYLNGSGTWSLADANSVDTTTPVIGLTQHAINNGQKGAIFLWGFIGDATWTWTLGGAIYASTTPGELTQTKPAVDAVIQSVGIPAFTQDIILFNPSFKEDLLRNFLQLNANNWEDLRFPASSIRLGGAAPATAQAYKDGLVLSFASTPNQFIYLIAQHSHGWDQGTIISPHLHWTIPTSGAGIGAENVKWDLTYSWSNQEAAIPNSTASTVTVDVQNQTADVHMITHFPDITDATKTLSSIMIISIKRDTAVANDYADPVYLLEFDIHFKHNRLGSVDENP